MKTYKYIALAALALGFAACTQDDDFAPQQEDIVKIASANIATEVQTRVNTLDDGTTFENTDGILLVNGSRGDKNSGAYTYNGTAWSLTDGMVLYASDTNATNNFTAYYPASVDFTLPIDQSTVVGIKSADRMVATADGVAKGAAVALSFERLNAKVSITPVFATQYEDKSDITDFKIGAITPYLPEGGNTYTAIIEPSGNGFSVSLTVGEDKLTATSTMAINAGKHYTFDLTVGKTAVGINSVSVEPWGDGDTLEGGEAEEVAPTIDGTLGGKTEATEEDVNALVEQLKGYVDNGLTTIIVPGSQPAMITVRNVSMTAIGEAIYRLSGNDT